VEVHAAQQEVDVGHDGDADHVDQDARNDVVEAVLDRAQRVGA